MKPLLSWCALSTPYNHAPCHFIKSHMRKVHVCSAVTCPLHFWQNDWVLLCATVTVETQGWNGYRNKSQHRKLTLEKKFSHCSYRDSNPRPFNHKSGALTTELSPLPGENVKGKMFFIHTCRKKSWASNI